MSAKILPTVLIAIDVAASVPYAFAGDWRRSCVRFGLAETISARSIPTIAAHYSVARAAKEGK